MQAQIATGCFGLKAATLYVIMPWIATGSTMEWTLYVAGKFFISLTFVAMYPFVTEIYPTTVRTSGLGVSALGARTGALVAPFINLLV